MARLAYEAVQHHGSEDYSWLLTSSDGAALKDAALSLPAGLQSEILSGSDGSNLSVDGSSALLPLQCAALLTRWLQEDRWLRISSEDWQQIGLAAETSSRISQLFQSLLLHLCARYLIRERRRNHAIDPVANFHLRNGAELWRLNWQ